MKKICFIVPTHHSYMMGGAQYQVSLIINRLLQEPDKYEIHYITQRAKKTEEFPYKIHVVNERIGKILGQTFNAPSVWRLLKKINPDIIYQRVAGGYTGVCSYFCKVKQKKMIFHIALELDVNPKEERKHTRISNIDSRLKNWGVKNAEIIIAQTGNQEFLLEKHFGRKANEQIYNFQPNPKNSNEKKGKKNVINICWVANVKVTKRPELFLDLAERYRSHEKFQFLMIGKMMGDQNFRNYFHSRIAKLPNLSYLGELPIEDVNTQIRKSDLLVSTSVSEGFSNTFIQAWFRGVPVYSLSSNPDFLFEKKIILGKFFDNNFEALQKEVGKFQSISANDSKDIKKLSEQMFSLRNIDRLVTYFEHN